MDLLHSGLKAFNVFRVWQKKLPQNCPLCPPFCAPFGRFSLSIFASTRGGSGETHVAGLVVQPSASFACIRCVFAGGASVSTDRERSSTATECQEKYESFVFIRRGERLGVPTFPLAGSFFSSLPFSSSVFQPLRRVG